MTFVSRLALLPDAILPQCLHRTPLRPHFSVAFFNNASYCFPVYVPKGITVSRRQLSALPPDQRPAVPAQIYFASSNGPVPDLAYQVDFHDWKLCWKVSLLIPALEQRYSRRCAVRSRWWLEFSTMASPATTFSVLFGKQQLGFSVVQGMANNIKIWRSNTSPDAAHARLFSATNAQ